MPDKPGLPSDFVRDRLSVVLLTHDRPKDLVRAVERLCALPERPEVIVVDNASSIPAEELVGGRPGVTVVRSPRNVGAVARSEGVARVRTPYVAFCDDDTWWAPGSLGRAVELLDAYPGVAVLAGRVLVGSSGNEDPTCLSMALSPLPRHELPGPTLIGFMAGACIMRTRVYRDAGGYAARLFLGGEEWLLSLDILSAGGRIVYAHDVVIHHHPSSRARDGNRRATATMRNRIWIAWMRLPAGMAIQETARAMSEARVKGKAGRVLIEALQGLPWALRQRRVVTPEVCDVLRIIMEFKVGGL